ncbi:hypothetical protein KC331_g2201 [Hortaea werneckii]|nr:hypothetical protein KC331_g2201 [Hortaea werneckii]KAI7715078.1 hypothetical protein KC353_g6372 [Hortaea werneckii]
MEALPPELIELIIQQCDFASLKQLRLVAKPFEHVATPLVFRDLYAAFFAYSLDNMGKWLTVASQNTFLAWEARRKELIAADCLKTHQTAVKLYACLDGDIEGGLCEECLGRIEDIRNEYRKNFPIPTLEQLERAWTRFCQLKHEQWTRITEDVHGIMLKEHLSRLPKLESVAAKPVTALFEDRLENLPVWKAEKRHPGLAGILDLLGRVLQWTLEAVGQRAQFSGTKQVRRLDIVQADPIPFQELMRAAADGSRTSDNPLAQGARFQTMVEAFSHVQDLTFELPHARQGEEYYGRHLRDETVELLRAAKNTEILKLHFPDDKLDGNQWSLIQGTPGMEDEDDVWGHYLTEGTSVEDGYHEDVKRYLLGQSEELPLLYDENLMNDSDEFEDESEEQSSEPFDPDEDDQSGHSL